MERVQIFDTTLRDGEQSPGATMTPAEKLRLAHQLDGLGVDVIEAGFPISSPDDFLSVQQICREVRRPVIAALARATEMDIDRAGKALENAERARLHTFIATSDIHLEHKLRISREECLAQAASAVERALRFTDDVEFSAEDATRTDIAFLCRVVQAAVDAGATTINIPDTVGYAYPDEVRRIVKTLLATVTGLDRVTLSVHCHNDLGFAVANSIAAVEAGARQVECTVNGIGERAGNAALEEIVMALKVRSDALPYITMVNTEEINRTSQLLSYITGIHPQPNKAIVGKNAFAHEAGIHQDGVIKNPSTYEIMTPEMVGLTASQLVLGKHSGRNALGRRYREMGYELAFEELDRAYKLFKMLADEKKAILDEDLISILHHGPKDDVPDTYKVKELEVSCGKRQAQARVGLSEEDGPTRSASALGDGPIAAAFAAIDSLVPHHSMELEELQVLSATPGQDAVGEVVVRVRIDGRTFTGRGASPDIIAGAVRAYVHALNKAASARTLEAQHLEKASYLWGV
ncbi:MAG TPA: 2-isopropylmalate synthase [Longimicrobiaceae bacterium]|nr:2-isopropylmalate synthase [Longimicrobiaceae bacterium]